MSKRAWRFRISVTALMVVVAVAALICFGATLRRRAKDYRLAMESNARSESFYREHAEYLLNRAKTRDDFVENEAQLDKDYHEMISRFHTPPAPEEVEQWEADSNK